MNTGEGRHDKRTRITTVWEATKVFPPPIFDFLLLEVTTLRNLNFLLVCFYHILIYL